MKIERITPTNQNILIILKLNYLLLLFWLPLSFLGKLPLPYSLICPDITLCLVLGVVLLYWYSLMNTSV